MTSGTHTFWRRFFWPLRKSMRTSDLPGESESAKSMDRSEKMCLHGHSKEVPLLTLQIVFGESRFSLYQSIHRQTSYDVISFTPSVVFLNRCGRGKTSISGQHSGRLAVLSLLTKFTPHTTQDCARMSSGVFDMIMCCGINRIFYDYSADHA